jgi:spermidine synthase
MSGVFTHRLASSGLIATLEPDKWRAGCWVLSVDGTPQSHVDLGDPTALHFDYIARMGHIIDRAFPTGEAITALHLGAGAMTIPRYIEATRPGSRQQVIELERDLIEFVREHCPLPRSASIRCRYGDAREMLGSLPTGLLGEVDLIVVDVYRGARTPAHVTTVEFYTALRRLLAPGGFVLANLTDGPPLAFAHNQFTTLRYVFGDVFGLAELGIASGKRYGNIVAAAHSAATTPAWVNALAGLGPHPTSLIAGDEARGWAAKGSVVTDATAIESPPPARNLFRS